MKKTATQSLSKQAMVLIMARGISFLVTLGIPLILVRYLTQAEFGAYKQSILLYTTAVTLLPWGMAQSLYYFIPQDPQDRGGYLANSFLFLVGIGILSLVGFSFAGPTLQHYFHSTELANSAMIIGIYLFFMISSIHWEIVLVADNRAKEAAGVILLNETKSGGTDRKCAYLAFVYRNYDGNSSCGGNSILPIRRLLLPRS